MIKYKYLLFFSTAAAFIGALVLYFSNFSSLQFSDKNGDWGAFGSYLGGLTTFFALIFAMSSVKEWRTQKLFEEHLSLVGVLAEMVFDATTYAEYTRAIDGEKSSGKDVDRYKEKHLKYRLRLTESWRAIYRAHKVIQATEKKIPEVDEVLNLLYLFINTPAKSFLIENEDNLTPVEALRKKTNIAISKITKGRIEDDDIGRNIDTLNTHIDHF
jgi:hypothetical protein